MYKIPTPHPIFSYGAIHGTDQQWVYFTQKVSEILGQSFIYKGEENLIYTKKPIRKRAGLTLWFYCQGLWDGGYFRGDTFE